MTWLPPNNVWSTIVDADLFVSPLGLDDMQTLILGPIITHTRMHPGKGLQP